jgi:hypothetical protein
MWVVEEGDMVEKCLPLCVLAICVLLEENGVLKVQKKNCGGQVGLPCDLPGRGFYFESRY